MERPKRSDPTDVTGRTRGARALNVAHPQRAEPPGREASAGGTKASSHPPPWSRPGAQSPTTTTLEKPGIPVPQAHHEGPAGRRQAMTDSVEAAGAEGLPGPGPGADGRLRGTRPLPGADRCRHPPRAWGRATRSSAGRSSQRPERSWRRRRTRPRWPPPAEETPASFPGFETSRDIGSGMISGEMADLRLSTSSHRPRYPVDRVEGTPGGDARDSGTMLEFAVTSLLCPTFGARCPISAGTLFSSGGRRSVTSNASPR